MAAPAADAPPVVDPDAIIAKYHAKGGDVEKKDLEEAQSLIGLSKKKLTKWVTARTNDTKQLVDDHKLMLAIRDVASTMFMLKHLNSSKEAPADVKEKGERLLSGLCSSEWVSELLRRVVETENLLEDFANDDDWRVVRDSDGRRTLYRNLGDSKIHQFKCVGTTLRAPFVNVIAVMYEIDLFRLWFPMLKSSEELALISKFRKLIRIEMKVPWPAQNREIIVDGDGVDMLEDNTICITLRSTNSFPGVKIDPPRKGVTRAEMVGGFLFKPVSRDETSVEFMIRTDPKMGMMPDGVLNWFTGKVLHLHLYLMGKAAHFKPDSEYPKRMEANPKVYKYAQDVVDKFFPADDEEKTDK